MACAWLEVQLAALACRLIQSKDIWVVASQPGRPLRDLRRIASQLRRGPLPTKVRRIVQITDALIRERDRITHSMLTLAHAADGGYTFATLQPRKAEPDVARHDPLPTAEQLRDLKSRIHRLIRQILMTCEPAAKYAGMSPVTDGRSASRVLSHEPRHHAHRLSPPR